jgi:hypothetical protein
MNDNPVASIESLMDAVLGLLHALRIRKTENTHLAAELAEVKSTLRYTQQALARTTQDRNECARQRNEALRRVADLSTDADRYRWLKENITHYDTAESERPVLASVSKRIWYHATDDVAWSLDAVIDNASLGCVQAGGGDYGG